MLTTIFLVIRDTSGVGCAAAGVARMFGSYRAVSYTSWHAFMYRQNAKCEGGILISSTSPLQPSAHARYGPATTRGVFRIHDLLAVLLWPMLSRADIKVLSDMWSVSRAAAERNG